MLRESSVGRGGNDPPKMQPSFIALHSQMRVGLPMVSHIASYLRGVNVFFELVFNVALIVFVGYFFVMQKLSISFK